MNRAAAIATLVLGIALPVCAQHGASHGGAGGGFHGGFSGHAAPASHGGFGSAASGRPAIGSRFAGGPGIAANRYRTVAPAYRMRSGAGPYNYGRGSVADSRDGDRHRRPYRPGYGYGYGSGFAYGYGGPLYGGWIGPGYYDYPDDGGYDSSSGNADAGNYPPDYYGQPDAQSDGSYEPPPYNYYRPTYQPPAAQSSAVPEHTQAITLVFKDGRTSEQIHNYILSRTTLSVLDEHRREIPVDQLDLDATVKANREAGVEFQLPRASM